jgi:hypothetical protein
VNPLPWVFRVSNRQSRALYASQLVFYGAVVLVVGKGMVGLDALGGLEEKGQDSTND